jgi:glycosyltransferase involved in cell wall biosynthesis
MPFYLPAEQTTDLMTERALSIIIPAYNEEAGIAAMLDHLLEVSADFPLDDVEIIIVDDGSSDGTSEIVQAYEDNHVRLIQHPQNKGYGAALKTGIRQASHEVLCIIDADNTYPAERIPDLFNEMQTHSADMVVGARTGDNVRIPLIRRPAKAFLRMLAGYVAEHSIPDLNSGLRLFRRDVVLRFFTLLPNQFSFTTTITLAMLVNGYHLRYVSINYAARTGRSKIKPIRDTLNFIQLVLRIALYFSPLRFFIPLSLLVALSGIIWGVSSLVVFGQFADASTLVIIMAALQFFGIGLLAELINKRIPNEYR